MKSSYLFLTHSNLNQPDVWKRFFSGHEGEYSIFCHPQAPELVTDPLLRDRIVSNVVPTQPGTVSVITATLNLIRDAYADPENAYFILASESCIPIYSFSVVQNAIRQAGGRIFRHYRDDSNEAPRRWASLPKPRLVKYREFRKQSQWMIFDRTLAALFLEHDITPLFERVYASDEHYFINLLVSLGFPLNEIPSRPSTFVNWKEREFVRTILSHPGIGENVPWVKSRPKTYTELSLEDVAAARSTGALLMRKIAPECDCSALEQSP